LKLAISGELGFDDDNAWSKTIPALKQALEWFDATVAQEEHEEA
jgi:hypothetical protein